MTQHVTIGEFSRLSYLSVKTLHHYHDVGLLAPASVDRSTGYRRYALDQVGQAHLIRRLRDLEMPVAEVRELLAAPDQASRDAALRAHLARMEAELDRTRGVVASLRELLTARTTLAVTYRDVPALPVLAVADLVGWADAEAWCAAAFSRLGLAAGELGVTPAGPSGATYSQAFFEDEVGEVVAFLPVPAGTASIGGVRRVDLPAGRFAVALHEGPFDDFDRTYGALGSHVAVHDEGRTGPIRELYLVGADETEDPAGYRTEICWPVRPA